MNNAEREALKGFIVGVIRVEVANAVKALPAPQDGKDADPAVIERMVLEAVAKIPPPQNGKDGSDGKDADPEVIEKMVTEAVAKIPVPKDGLDGKDGAPGVNGKDGKDVDPLVIKEMVVQVVSALPPAKDGRDGKDGKDGLHGKDGKDGVASTDQLIAMVGKAVTETVDAKLPEHLAEIRAEIAERDYKGLWQEGVQYRRHNQVTWGGQMFHCDEDTTDKPDSHFGTGAKGKWTLMVKKGRDGR